MKFKNKVAFITGGASGIGRDAALTLTKQGAKVIITDWNKELGEETLSKLRKHNSDAQFFSLDVRDYDAVKSVISKVATDFGRIDIAINSAGIGASSFEPTGQSSLKDWERVVAINQTGLYYCMREQLAVMQDQGSGSIINLASIAGLKAFPGQIAYVASKHAVIGMSKTAAAEYARAGIRVNALCPVFTITPLVENMFDLDNRLEDKLLKGIPMRRYGEVNDITNAILWLADDSSSFVTGLALPIDGGMMA